MSRATGLYPTHPDPRRATDAPAALAGDQELTDARPNARERWVVKRLLMRLEKRLSADALMFLTGGVEDAALRKRAEEGQPA
jgi:hypothetical protein